jgi:hypothetical protein
MQGGQVAFLELFGLFGFAEADVYILGFDVADCCISVSAFSRNREIRGSTLDSSGFVCSGYFVIERLYKLLQGGSVGMLG